MAELATEFRMTDAPPMDEPPELTEPTTVNPNRGWGEFGDIYPDATPDAPYGYKSDGTPFKRHHGRGRKQRGEGGRMPATAKQAETAAALLARLNGLFGLALTVAGMPMSAMKLAENNEQFEDMARQALETDPELCRKILSAGATSGKAGLVVAYAMLGVSTFPAMRQEYREAHPKQVEEGMTDDA